MSQKERYIVGLSGGVDSSVAAARLLDAGHEVVAVYLKAWQSSEDGERRTENGPNILRFSGSCPWKDDIADGRRVAAQLGIAYEVIDVHEAYRARVVDVMLAEYRAGRTPNPDILCNREMKFGLLLDVVRELGFDGVATGHYARITPAVSRADPRYSIPNTRYELHRGRDARKDQTYFLWNIPREALAMIEFPIGESTKTQVRTEARRRSLPTAGKKDSQGICFLGPVDLRQFLIDQLRLEPGEVVDTTGRVIGRHRGAAAYTVGQREGFEVNRVNSVTSVNSGASSNLVRSSHSIHLRSAYYVVERDLKRNRLVVDVEPPKSRELVATQLNWLVEPPTLKVGDRIEARIRHGQQPEAAEVNRVNSVTSVNSGASSNLVHSSNSIHLRFERAQGAVAPGQSVVFSEDSQILGGGIIA